MQGRYVDDCSNELVTGILFFSWQILGCDFKLHNEDCAAQCTKLSTDESVQNSCQVGCTLSRPTIDEPVYNPPILAVDPTEVRVKHFE